MLATDSLYYGTEPVAAFGAYAESVMKIMNILVKLD